jgi:hypothetical protein
MSRKNVVLSCHSSRRNFYRSTAHANLCATRRSICSACSRFIVGLISFWAAQRAQPWHRSRESEPPLFGCCLSVRANALPDPNMENWTRMCGNHKFFSAPLEKLSLRVTFFEHFDAKFCNIVVIVHSGIGACVIWLRNYVNPRLLLGALNMQELVSYGARTLTNENIIMVYLRRCVSLFGMVPWNWIF